MSGAADTAVAATRGDVSRLREEGLTPRPRTCVCGFGPAPASQHAPEKASRARREKQRHALRGPGEQTNKHATYKGEKVASLPHLRQHFRPEINRVACLINARKEDAPVISGAQKLVVCCHEPLLRDRLERGAAVSAGGERPRELADLEEGHAEAVCVSGDETPE